MTFLLLFLTIHWPNRILLHINKIVLLCGGVLLALAPEQDSKAIGYHSCLTDGKVHEHAFCCLRFFFTWYFNWIWLAFSLGFQLSFHRKEKHFTLFFFFLPPIYIETPQRSFWILRPSKYVCFCDLIATLKNSKVTVVLRWMIHREEWVLNIFIQHQYSLLTDTYKRHSTSYKQLTRQFTRNRGGSKCCIAKWSKLYLNINQFIKSTLEVFNHRLFMSQSIW